MNYINENARVSNDMLEAYVEDLLTASGIARSATNRLGNALYRDGVGSFGINVDWHAGLVAHASGPMYNRGAWVIHHPGGNAVQGCLGNIVADSFLVEKAFVYFKIMKYNRQNTHGVIEHHEPDGKLLLRCGENCRYSKKGKPLADSK